MQDLARQASLDPGPHAFELFEEIRRQAGVIRRGWRVIGISILICLMVSLIYLAVAKRVYQAGSRLLILQQGGRPLNVANTDPSRLMEGAEDYLPTHALILSSPLVVRRAIDRVGLDRLPSLRAAQRAGQDPIEVAIANLKVTRPDRLAKILRVEYQANDPVEVVRMVEAITGSYTQVLEESFQTNSGTAIVVIKKARDDLGRELQDLEGKYLELRRKSPTTITGEEGRTLMASRLARWEQAANEATLKAVQLKRQLELGRRLARDGTELWAVAHAINQLGGDTSNLTAIITTSQDGAAEYVRQLNQEQQQLTERFGPNYAKVQELKAQIERVRHRVRGARSGQEGGEVNDLLDAIEQSLQSVQAMRDELDKQSAQDQQKAKQAGLALLAEEALRNKLERQRALFNTVVEQLKQAQFVSVYSSVSSQIIDPARPPRGPIWPRAGLTLALAVVVGGGLGMGVVVVLDRLDQRIRSLNEIRRVTGLSVLGQVELMPEAAAGVVGPFGLISHARPRSVWAEGYRTVRTQIDFLGRDQRLQVLQVTSACMEEGKSSSASNLAISFALSGRKVLLIDADLHRSVLDKLYDLNPTPGLSHLLKNLMPLHRVAQRSRVENLDVITTGPEVSNPAELLSSSRLTTLLDEARQYYDIIIVDSPPLLAVTDSAIIGSVVDGVVLVVRAWVLKRQDAELSLERLQRLGTPILGLLVNGVGREDSGYGSGYGFGYDLDRLDRASEPDGGEVRTPAIAARTWPRGGWWAEPGPPELT